MDCCCVTHILLAVLCLLLPQAYGGDVPICGILNTRPNGTSESSEKYCISFYRDITSLPSDDKTAEYFQISDALDWNICNDTEPPPHLDLENRLIFVSSENNCSVTERASIVQKHGGAGTLIVESKLNLPEQEDLNYNFTLGFIDNSSYVKIMETADNVTTAGMYSPKDSPLHISLIIIWILAVFSVSVGAFWSGSVRHRLYLSEQCSGASYESRGEHLQEPVLPQEETSMNLSPKTILLFVVMMCTMLLLLYFLYDYLVYMIMGMFCIASGAAMYSCLEPLVSKIPCGSCRTPYFNIYIVRGTLEFRQILLLIFSFGLSITWIVMRKEPWAWILQDILGITFSINVLKVIRLPSLKICTILLCGLVIYDIFFVFVTPLITADGKSIMVEVAKGGASREQLPMVLKVPNFSYYEIADICGLKDNYNLLGFGDILIPGLLVAFTSAFDRQVGTPCHLYYLVNVIGYGSGLVLTFVALYFMSVAQPALLYLVPSTLIPTFITSACRGEFLAMWRGDSDKDMDDIMSCKICMENFTDHIRPRTLKCGHSFCTRCLGNFISNGSLMCPMCQLPVKGKSALDFPINFSMEEMISSLKLTQDGGTMGKSLSPPSGGSPSLKLSGTANAPLLQKEQGMSSLMHNLVLQHKENSKVLARDSKKIQSYLEKYRNYLDDKRREHDHFVVQMMELVDKNRQVIRQIEAERERVCCSLEQGVVCQNRLDGNLASLDAVLTSKDAASTIEELDRCCADLEKWNCTVQSQLPDSKVVACSEAITEESRAAVEAAYVHQKDNLEGISSNALDFTHSPLSVIDKLHRCQGKPTIYVPNLKNKSEFLKKLLKTKRLYAVSQSKGKVRSAMLTFIDNKVYLPCLRDSEPPEHAHTIDHRTLISSLNNDDVTAFLDLSWGGITRGRIHIRLAPDTRLARNFRSLCTGDSGKSYLHSRFLEVYKQGYTVDECIRAGDYETNTGMTGAVVVLGSDPKEAVYSRKIVTGMVWATHKDLDGPMTSQFSIRTGRGSLYWVVGGFGQVIDGIEVVKEAAKLKDVFEVQITECGVIVPLC